MPGVSLNKDFVASTQATFRLSFGEVDPGSSPGSSLARTSMPRSHIGQRNIFVNTKASMANSSNGFKVDIPLAAVLRRPAARAPSPACASFNFGSAPFEYISQFGSCEEWQHKKHNSLAQRGMGWIHETVEWELDPQGGSSLLACSAKLGVKLLGGGLSPQPPGSAFGG